MRSRNNPSRLVIFLLAISLGPNLQAQMMKLVAPGTGWRAIPGGQLTGGYKLLWTSDNGAHWRDITPHQPTMPKGAMLSKVFFRNGFEGWVIAACQDSTVEALPGQRKTLYSLMHTRNSGENWDATPLAFSLSQPEQDAFAGLGGLYFLDSMHGWIEVDFAGMSRQGKLLATEDGGLTWNWVGTTIFSGQFFFSSPTDGWLIGYWDDDRLHVTHDGAKSWQNASLKPPPELGAAIYPRLLDLPVFKDSQHGSLLVRYPGSPGGTPKFVVYATHSGGTSWQPLKTLSVPADTQFALIDSTLILPTNSVPGKFSTESVSLTDQAQPAKPASSQNVSGIQAFSFADVRNGWALTRCGLYATTDGGATWKNISSPPTTPLPKPSFVLRQTPSGHVVTKAPPTRSPCDP